MVIENISLDICTGKKKDHIGSLIIETQTLSVRLEGTGADEELAIIEVAETPEELIEALEAYGDACLYAVKKYKTNIEKEKKENEKE